MVLQDVTQHLTNRRARGGLEFIPIDLTSVEVTTQYYWGNLCQEVASSMMYIVDEFGGR